MLMRGLLPPNSSPYNLYTVRLSKIIPNMKRLLPPESPIFILKFCSAMLKSFESALVHELLFSSMMFLNNCGQKVHIQLKQ